VIYAGGDWMPGYRFLLPAIPLYFVLASLGLDRVWQIVRSHLLPAGRLWGIVLFLCFVALSLSTVVKEDQYVLSRARGYQQAHFAVGMWLRENSSPDASVALMDIGLIGYVSDRYVLDITGLTSREVARIAHQGGGWALAPEEIAIQVADYVLSQEPDYIVLAHVTPSLDLFAGWRFDWAIFHSPSFSARYQHIFTVQHTDDYYLSVFGKQGSTR
jgi:arabinofuranosyltransferase